MNHGTMTKWMVLGTTGEIHTGENQGNHNYTGDMDINSIIKTMYDIRAEYGIRILSDQSMI